MKVGRWAPDRPGWLVTYLVDTDWSVDALAGLPSW